MGVKVSRVTSRIRAFDQSGGVLGRLWADEHALALALYPTSSTAGASADASDDTPAIADVPLAAAAASTSTTNSASTVEKMFTVDTTSIALVATGSEKVVVLSNA